MLFLVDQFARELQGRADVFHGQVVLTLYFLEAHAAGQAAYHDRDGRARTPNDRFAVADCRINRNSVMHAGVRVRHAHWIGKPTLMQLLQVTPCPRRRGSVWTGGQPLSLRIIL
jgi:hypothetical protein